MSIIIYYYTYINIIIIKLIDAEKTISGTSIGGLLICKYIYIYIYIDTLMRLEYNYLFVLL